DRPRRKAQEGARRAQIEGDIRLDSLARHSCGSHRAVPRAGSREVVMDNLRGAASWPHDVRVGIGFMVGLPSLLRNPIDPAKARVILAQRQEHRDADFLALARRTIYGEPSNPVGELLRNAGCAYGDLARLVDQESLEGALHALFRRGVYLTEDELKG